MTESEGIYFLAGMLWIVAMGMLGRFIGWAVGKVSK